MEQPGPEKQTVSGNNIMILPMHAIKAPLVTSNRSSTRKDNFQLIKTTSAGVTNFSNLQSLNLSSFCCDLPWLDCDESSGPRDVARRCYEIHVLLSSSRLKITFDSGGNDAKVTAGDVFLSVWSMEKLYE